MNHIHSTSLPEPIARYLDSANRFDAAGASGSFTPDAAVRDEQHEYVGHAAIERWIAQTSQSYQAQVTVTNVLALGANVKIAASIAGNFSGSPVDLDYDFCLQDGKIARLTIQ